MPEHGASSGGGSSDAVKPINTDRFGLAVVVVK
jgi:hypothetical protein